MAQNTFIPEDWNQYTAVDSSVALEPPYNPDKVAELVNAAFTVGPGGVAYLGCGPQDTLVEVYLPLPVAQQDIDDAVAKLNAICLDPTRSDLTAEQQEAAAVAAERAKINTKIDQAAADKDAINTDGTGLKDRITGNNDLAVNGINDLLRDNVFNAAGVTNAQKIETLRVQVLELADIVKSLAAIVASTRADDAYLMREKRRNLNQ